MPFAPMTMQSAGDAARQLRVQRFELFGYRRLEAERLLDLNKAFDDLAEGARKIGSHARSVLAEVKQVGDLRVAGITLAGRGGHDDPATRVRLDDGAHLAELRGVGEAGATEFADDPIHLGSDPCG